MYWTALCSVPWLAPSHGQLTFPLELLPLGHRYRCPGVHSGGALRTPVRASVDDPGLPRRRDPRAVNIVVLSLRCGCAARPPAPRPLSPLPFKGVPALNDTGPAGGPAELPGRSQVGPDLDNSEGEGGGGTVGTQANRGQRRAHPAGAYTTYEAPPPPRPHPTPLCFCMLLLRLGGNGEQAREPGGSRRAWRPGTQGCRHTRGGGTVERRDHACCAVLAGSQAGDRGAS